MSKWRRKKKKNNIRHPIKLKNISSQRNGDWEKEVNSYQKESRFSSSKMKSQFLLLCSTLNSVSLISLQKQEKPKS